VTTPNEKVIGIQTVKSIRTLLLFQCQLWFVESKGLTRVRSNQRAVKTLR
jgi:hypothetical protein